MKSRIDQRTVFAVTLGCPKNRVDTEVMLGDMLSSNYALVDSPGEADVVIVNTCGFLHAAREESLQALKDVSNEMRPGARLVAAGCMIGRFGDLIEAAVPSVSLMVDTLDFNAISKRLEGLPPPPGAFPTSADPRLVTTGSYAYLKVADGCDRRCSFCIIPSIKGGQRSRPIRDLVVEAGALVRGGAREIVLIAQDLARYGSDLDGDDDIVKLINALQHVDGLEWVRLMYLYPDDVTDGLIDAVAESVNCLPYFDIPIQHGDSGVLARMNRGGDAGRILNLVRRIRDRIPGAVLRTTLMTGFPGETPEAFDNMLALARAAEFDMVGVFQFSPEPGSAAARLPDQVPSDVAAARCRTLQDELSRIAARNREGLVGRCFQAVAEHIDEDGRVVGRMWFQAPEVDGVTYIDGLSDDDETVMAVQVTGFRDSDFFARVQAGPGFFGGNL